MKVYQKLASLIGAIENCNETLDNENSTDSACKNADEWIERHQSSIDLILTMFPSGSGFDSGTNLEQLEKPFSTPERLVFKTSYHHMNENGYYDSWTDHVITVTPSLQFGFNVKVSGKNRNDIKNYIAEMFSDILDKEVSL